MNSIADVRCLKFDDVSITGLLSRVIPNGLTDYGHTDSDFPTQKPCIRYAALRK
jgi:hypothetical protein